MAIHWDNPWWTWPAYTTDQTAQPVQVNSPGSFVGASTLASNLQNTWTMTSTGYAPPAIQPPIVTDLALGEDGVHIMVGTMRTCIVPIALLEKLEGLMRMAALAKLVLPTEP